ncbi:MAG: Bifunctional aspartate aminotransferase and L-aspartate beta-decarboxylase [Chlamydiae bacterium]|nr:Bifunctional aspartate aminotransferase and L-aspartate beta-decarboxylase [Chlamydiota bacterium]
MRNSRVKVQKKKRKKITRADLNVFESEPSSKGKGIAVKKKAKSKKKEYASVLNIMKHMSPFEVKDILIQEAKKTAKKRKATMLNAGRGNPDFLNTTVRDAFSLLCMFVTDCSNRYLKQKNLGLRPDKKGLARKFFQFLNKQKKSESRLFLEKAMRYAIKTFKYDADAFIFEMTDAALGDFYPMPPRVFPFMEKILRAYIDQILYLSPKMKKTKCDLFCTEGATAAMIYIFNSLKLNGLLRKGDEIAIITPIFSPYLEIPLLDEFKLKEVFIESDEDLEWQIPDKELKKLENPKVKALFLVNPANPTSVALHPHVIKKIGQIVRNKRKDLIVLTDTVYATFVNKFYCLLDEVPDNTICVYSYSKYFGVTGWRLGFIMMSQNHVIDKLLKKLPQKQKKILYDRYRMIHPDPNNMSFIDRLETDSRHEALAHTGGLSCPQQAIMTLFSLFNLMDKKQKYKDDVHQILVKRMKYLFHNLEMKMPKEKGNTYYYVLLDFIDIAEQKYGKPFAKYLEKNVHLLEFLYRLAQEKMTICLPGEGFHGPDWSLRVSLANLHDNDYKAVGKNLNDMLKIYYNEWKKG